MENWKTINSQIQLPEAIIQHIQSFLRGKEAARTTILSKSWYSAWSTRPDLDFDQRDFGCTKNKAGDEKDFWEFAQKTMQRYEGLNLKIESFRLWMTNPPSFWRYSYSLADKLIVEAMKLGATDINFKFICDNMAFTLPQEVLGSGTLNRLSVAGCRIDVGVDTKVSCSKLKSLSLRRVLTEGNIIWDIMSSCPLIEKLSLSRCTCLIKIRSFGGFRSTMTTISPFNEFAKQNMGSVVDAPIGFCKLKCLFLEEVNIDTQFFHDLSSKFPCLKDLSVHNCGGYKGIRISSASLERISFVQNRMLRAKFDVPSICKFTYKGSALPCISFKKYSGRCKSDISYIFNGQSS